MKKLRGMAVALFVVFAFHCGYARMEDNGRVVYEVEFREPKITTSTFSPGYDHIEMDSTRSLGKVSEPQLPIGGICVLIPFDKEIDTTEIVLGERVTLPGRYKIEPGQKEYPIGQTGKPDEPDPKIYESNNIYPSIRHELVSVQKKLGRSIAVIQLFPVEYRPKSGEISYYKKITVQIILRTPTVRNRSSTEIKTTPRLGTKPEDEAAILRLIDNKEDMVIKSRQRTLNTSSQTATDTAYVIITREDFVESFEDLRARREKTHGGAAIVTTDDIYKNYSGVDEQDKIRNFIRYAYNNWGTMYVLLGGDGDGADVGGESGDDIIPARGLKALDDSNIPADLYYACLDGPFDNDKDGVYGEKTDGENGGDVDLFSEVYIGRAPVDSVLEADNFVRKTIAYEDDSTDDYLKNSYMVSDWHSSKYSSIGIEVMERIRLGTSEGGFTTQGFLSNPNRAMDANTLYDSCGTEWSKDDLISIMNDGVHVLNHLGHSDVYTNMRLKNSDVNDLSNDKYFIVYSNGCHAAAFDNKTSYKCYLSSDCMAEHFVTGFSGAVAYIGNSRLGDAGPNQRYNRQFWDALFGENIRELGRMTHDSKEDNISFLSSSDGMRYWCFGLNLLGDPALSINLPDNMILAMSNCEMIDLTVNPWEPSIGLITTIKAFNQDASDVTATLSFDSPYITIDPSSASHNYENILKGESKDNFNTPFKFKISPDCPKPFEANFILTLSEGSGYSKSINISEVLPSFKFDKQQITFSSKVEAMPAISGNYIVWEDHRNGNADIYFYDISTGVEKQITFDPKNQTNPAISGDYIVWEDYRNGNADIYLYDISTGVEKQITSGQENQTNPAISGDYIVWVDRRNNNSDIYFYDLSTNIERQITFDPKMQITPAIFGNYIVWQDYCNGNYDIYLYDLSANVERRIISPGWQYNPVISGNCIVWENTYNRIADIYLYDLSTNITRQITSDPWFQCVPAISGSYIVWQDNRNGDDDIYLYDISTGVEKQITFDPKSQQTPAISGNYIIWTEENDVYLTVFDLTSPSKSAVIDDGIFTTSMTTLNASWISSDPETGIAEYMYCITQDSGTGTLIKNWTSTGTANSISADGLTLENNKSYYFGVVAKNKAGLWSEAGYSDGIMVDVTPPAGTIKINNGAVYAISAVVNLNLSATDERSGVSQMRFSNDGTPYAGWKTYSTLKAWTLLSRTGDGAKTVYVQFRDVAGNQSQPAKKTITLDTTKPKGTIYINNNAASTTSTSVTLKLSATDAGSGMASGQMQFSNNNVVWSIPPDAYSTSKSWKLSSGNGTKTVYAKFKDAAGNWSVVVSDSIIKK